MLDATWNFEHHHEVVLRLKPEPVLLEGKLINEEYRPRYNVSFFATAISGSFLVGGRFSRSSGRAFSARPVQKGRRQPLLLVTHAHAGALRQTLNFHAEKVRCAHIWTSSPSARIEISDLASEPGMGKRSWADQYRAAQKLQACEFL